MTACGSISDLPEKHLIRILLDEHQTILTYLNVIDILRKEIFSFESPVDHPEVFMKLISITERLMTVAKHHEREEEVLFPELIKADAGNHLKVLTSEHQFLLEYKQKFFTHINNLSAMDFKSYKLQLNFMANGIIGILKEHIYLENTAVFPVAVNVITDKKQWTKMNQRFMDIGSFLE
ncbi:MAG: hemerythrin domain-containing protein [Fidelibacterota bacterium]